MLDPKLTSLLAVVDKKSVTKAAASLSLTQPAVSHHIKELEAELGTVLFARGKGALRLTEAGETVVGYARRMAALYDNLHAALADSERRLTRLRVGITHTAESNLVAEALAQYGHENPGVTLTVITDSIKNLYGMIENYELDLAIVEGSPRQPHFHSLLLDTDYLVCVAANENPLASQKMVSLNDLKGQSMILRLPKSGTVNLFAAHLKSIGESLDAFNVVLEVDNIATIKDLIRKDFGVSILPKSTCRDEVRKGKLTTLPIENMSMIRETNLVYREDFSHPDMLQGFLSLYRTLAERKPTSGACPERRPL